MVPPAWPPHMNAPLEVFLSRYNPGASQVPEVSPAQWDMASRLIREDYALPVVPPRGALLAASKGSPATPRDPGAPVPGTTRARTLAALRGPQPPAHPPSKVLRELRVVEKQAFGNSLSPELTFPRMYPPPTEVPIPGLGEEQEPEIIYSSDEEVKEELADPVQPAPAGFLEPALRDLPEDPRKIKDIKGVYGSLGAWHAAVQAWDLQLMGRLRCMKDSEQPEEPEEPVPANGSGPRTPPQGPLKKSQSPEPSERSKPWFWHPLGPPAAPEPRERSEPWSWDTPWVDPKAASRPDDTWGSWTVAGKAAKEVPAGMQAALLEHVHLGRLGGHTRKEPEGLHPALLEHVRLGGRPEGMYPELLKQRYDRGETSSSGKWELPGGSSSASSDAWQPAAWWHSKEGSSTSTESWGSWNQTTASTEVKGEGKGMPTKKRKGYGGFSRPQCFNHDFKP